MQIAKDGRRILWLAHESAPKNFTGVDVTDPRKPKVIVPDRPAARRRALELARDVSATSWRSPTRPSSTDMQPAGFELFDISEPEKPQVDRLLRCSGAAFARRAPALVLRRRIRAHGLGRAGLQADQPARRPVLPHHRRAQSVEADGSRPLVACRAPRRATTRRRRRATTLDKGYRAHNTNVYPQRPDRCYLGYLDGGMHRARHLRQVEPEAHLALDQLAALHRLHAHGACRCSSATCCSSPTSRPRTTPRTGRSWSGCSTRATRPTWCRSRPARCRRSRPIASAAAASARTTSTRTCRCRPAVGTTRSCSAPSSTAACAPTTSPTRTSRRRSATFVPPAPSGSPTGVDPDQRRVRRRARGRLHGRPLHRRPLLPGDGFLRSACTAVLAGREGPGHCDARSRTTSSSVRRLALMALATRR